MTATNPDKRIPVMEIFGPTIQGEGVVIGQQTFFIRFGLCDFRCKMCDSLHAVLPNSVRANGHWLTQDEIYNAITNFRQDNAPHGTKWITFSGGNPAIHDLHQLVRRLKDDDWHIAVETQGTLAPTWLRDADVVTVSPKGPGMGERCELDVLDRFLDNVRGAWECVIKIVVFDQRDLEFAKMLYERYGEFFDFYLSLGNPWPPDVPTPDPLPPKPELSNTDPEHVERLVTIYLRLFEDIKNDPILSQMKFLPQWHVFVWGNAKGK